MKLLLAGLLLCALLPGSARADWGLWEAGIYIETEVEGMVYLHADHFNGASLGDYSSSGGDILRLRGGLTKSWKNGPSEITAATFHYRLHAVSQPPGDFIEVDLPFDSWETSPYGSINETWLETNLTVNLLDDISRGTYRLEFFTRATGTSPDRTLHYDNFGNYFAATFNVDMPTLTVNDVNADYTTTRCFIDETASDSHPIEVVFLPNEEETITHVEVYSNLNRRDYATRPWTNEHGVVTHEGIYPRPRDWLQTGMTNHYYKVWPMQEDIPNQRYTLTLHARKTGAYRLTVRYKTEDQPDTWHWYTDRAFGRRDHAIMVIPTCALDMVMYELNTFNIKATNATQEGRSTFVDLWDGPGADPDRPEWNLDYLQQLGVNWLWFQPVHPYGEDGRHLSARDIRQRAGGGEETTWLWNDGDPYEDVDFPYALGSPYAVKNFWEIEPLMSRGETRESAMQEFAEFVDQSAQRGVRVMLDAAFNHTAWDVELGDLGVELFAPEANPTNEIRHTQPRFFSKVSNYHHRATSADEIAPAPDRNDFGKWLDAYDVYFGRYAALWDTEDDWEQQRNEEDWFDYSIETGHFDQITQNVWMYFGAYIPYWLEKTGYTADTPPENLHTGIDGLRCDFAQGLPPQAWEYIVNRARSVKWNFLFMAESLDGGEVTYRSSRHFDILNENIVFAQEKNNPDALNSGHIRNIFEDRRNWYGESPVLLATTSHDEDNYANPWHPFIRYAALSTMDGVPMIFAGQEIGLQHKFGYELMERNFGKFIPHFKTWNSMMPLWNARDTETDYLFASYAAVGRARHASPALRSHDRYFLNRLDTGNMHNHIFAVAKYENQDDATAPDDVVFAFVNLNRTARQTNTFNVNVDLGEGNLFGIQPDRQYNVVNLAAFSAIHPDRHSQWLWGNEGRPGSDVLENGIPIEMHPVPSGTVPWNYAPYEPLYLRLYDVTPPVPAPTNHLHYVLGDTATFAWNPVPDPTGEPVHYRITVFIDDEESHTDETGNAIYTVTAQNGQTVRLKVEPFNDNISSGDTFESDQIHLLSPDDDSDGDGMLNWQEALAGTDPLDSNSVFRITNVYPLDGEAGHQITIGTVPGRVYTIYYSDGLGLEDEAWTAFDTYAESGPEASSHTFVDDHTQTGPPEQHTRYYMIDVHME